MPNERYHRVMEEGYRAEKAQDWEQALQAYARAELLRPDDPAANRALTRVQIHRDHAFYKQAVKQARDAEEKGDWLTAANSYEEALRWNPNDVEAKTGRNNARFNLEMQQGHLAEQSQNWTAAKLAFNRALFHKPRDADALAALARLPRERQSVLWTPNRAQVDESNRSQPVAITTSPSTAVSNGKLPEIKVQLEWNRDGLPRSGSLAAKPSAESVAGYLLDKTGDSTIAVAVIPATDTNAWSLLGDYESVADDKTALYRLVGRHLLIAEHLLRDADLAQRRRGLAFALQATRAAARRIKDMPLAVAIADSFLLPHFETAGDTNSSAWLSSRSVLEEIIATYILAKDETRQTAGYRLMLERATDSNTADFVRFRLAQLSRKAGRDEEALKFLREITPGKGGMAGMRRLIPGIERKLQLQNPKQGVKQ